MVKQSLLIITLILSSSISRAQHDHSTHSHDAPQHSHAATPPHGGEIKDVGKYHFEILFDAYNPEEKLNVWVLKSNMKVISPKKFSGKIKLHYKDGKEEALDMIMVQDKLVCNIKDLTQPFSAIILITINGKEYQAVYEYKGLGK